MKSTKEKVKENAVKVKKEKKSKIKGLLKKKEKIKKIPLQNPWSIIIVPHLSEKNIGLVETENKLVFIVNEKSNKRQVKWAVERAFDVKVVNVNILNDRKNRKKAFVKLSPECNALDIATRLGML